MEQTLALGRAALLEHKEDPHKSGETGIEPDLVGIFLEQMIELNKFMYTTFSTNQPYNLVFQEMFVGGYIEKYKLTDRFLNDLRAAGYSYAIRNYHTEETIRYVTPGANKNMQEYARLNPRLLKHFEEDVDYRLHPLALINGIGQWGMELNEHTTHIEQDIRSGNIVLFVVVNYSDPLDRKLYQNLVDIFKRQTS